MTKKDYLNKIIDSIIYPCIVRGYTPDDIKMKVKCCKELLKNCVTDEDYLNVCKTIDEAEDTMIESQFCRKFRIPYTGKLCTKIELYYRDGCTQEHNKVDSLELLEEDHLKINDYITIRELKSVSFVDKCFSVNGRKDLENIVKHYKNLCERIKLQEIESDFK